MQSIVVDAKGLDASYKEKHPLYSMAKYVGLSTISLPYLTITSHANSLDPNGRYDAVLSRIGGPSLEF